MQIQIPKPLDEYDFERGIKVLFRCILGDPGVDRHGRRGQAQQGVDVHGLILGRRNGNRNRIVGIQCKLKGHGKELTVSEVQEEVEKALQFKPPLSEYYIVTTAPRDTKLGKLALELTEPKSKEHPEGMRVCVWGWETLREEIQQHSDAIKAFDPSCGFWSDQFGNKLDEANKELDDIRRNRKPSSHIFEPIIDDSAIHDEVVSQINEYAALVRDQPSVALKLLESLLERHGSTASNHIRFRIVSNIAGCHLNLGNDEVAAKGFNEAFDLDPENPKAVANKALGFLISKDWDNLRLFAEANFPEYPDNAQLAAFFIHSLIYDKAVSDPLDRVPEVVRNSAEVMIANVRWLMKRGDDGDWWRACKAAYKVNPQNAGVIGTLCRCTFGPGHRAICLRLRP